MDVYGWLYLGFGWDIIYVFVMIITSTHRRAALVKQMMIALVNVIDWMCNKYTVISTFNGLTGSIGYYYQTIQVRRMAPSNPWTLQPPPRGNSLGLLANLCAG